MKEYCNFGDISLFTGGLENILPTFLFTSKSCH